MALPVALGALAVSSLVLAFSLALGGYKDFQIDGSRGLLQGIDPFETQELSDGSAVRSPINYGHLIYLLLAPLLLLSDEGARLLYAILNCILCGCSVYVLGRRIGLGARSTFLVMSVVFISGPVRVAISNSQTSILVLFLVCLLGVQGGARGSIGLGLASFKFSFLPIALPYIFAPSRRTVLFGLGILGPAGIAVGLTLDFGVFVSPFLRQISEPRVSFGFGDLATMMRHFAVDGRYIIALAVLAIFVGGIVILVLVKDFESQVIALLILSLITLPHLFYDYVLLLPLLFRWMEFPKSTSKNVSILLLAIVGFVPSILDAFELGLSSLFGIRWTLFLHTWLGTNIAVLILLQVLLWMFVREVRRQAVNLPRR